LAGVCFDWDVPAAIASNHCLRNPNRSIDWHWALLDSARARSMWAIASGPSSLKLDGFSQPEAELGSEFDIARQLGRKYCRTRHIPSELPQADRLAARNIAV